MCTYIFISTVVVLLLFFVFLPGDESSDVFYSLASNLNAEYCMSPAAINAMSNEKCVYSDIITLIEGFLVEKPLYQPEGRAKCTSETRTSLQ